MVLTSQSGHITWFASLLHRLAVSSISDMTDTSERFTPEGSNSISAFAMIRNDEFCIQMRVWDLCYFWQQITSELIRLL